MCIHNIIADAHIKRTISKGAGAHISQTIDTKTGQSTTVKRTGKANTFFAAV